MRDAPTLRAHPNVIDMAAWKRARERPVRVTFPGYVSERLTEAEIAALRQRAKENIAYLRKAFAHLKPIAEVDERRRPGSCVGSSD